MMVQCLVLYETFVSFPENLKEYEGGGFGKNVRE